MFPPASVNYPNTSFGDHDVVLRNCESLGFPVPVVAWVLGNNVDPGIGESDRPQAGWRREVVLNRHVSKAVPAQPTGSPFPVLRLDNDTGNANRAYFSPNVYVQDDITIFTVCTPRRQGVNTEVVAVGKWYGTAASDEWMLSLNDGAGAYQPAFYIAIGGARYSVQDPSTWATNERLTLCATRSKNELRLYREGAVVASSTGCATGVIQNVRTQIDLGQYVFGPAGNGQIDYECVLIFDRPLTPTQVAMLSSNPYLLWDDMDDEDSISIKAGSTYNISVIEAGLHLAQNIHITESHQSIASTFVMRQTIDLPGSTEGLISVSLYKTQNGGRQITRIGSTLYALAYDATHTYVLNSTDEGHSWTSESVIGWQAVAGCIIQGDTGPAIALCRGNSDNRIRCFKRSETGSWDAAPTVGTGNSSNVFGFQLLYDGSLFHLLYAGRSSSTNKRNVYHRTSVDLSAWNAATLLDEGQASGYAADVDRAISACMDSAGDIHLVYCQNVSSKFFLRYRKRTSGTWGSVELIEDLGSDSAGSQGRVAHLSIVTDTSVNPHVYGEKYYGSVPQIVYYAKDGSWSSALRVNPSSSAQNNPSGGMNAGVFPNVVYGSLDGDSSVWYAENRDVGWSAEGVSNDEFGMYPDQVYDPYRHSAITLQGLFMTMQSSLDFVVTSDLVWGDSASTSGHAVLTQQINVRGRDIVTSTVSLSDAVNRFHAYSETMSQGLGITATANFKRDRPRSITQAAAMAQAIGLNFTPAAGTRIINQSVLQSVALESRVPLGNKSRPLSVGQTIVMTSIIGLTYFEAVLSSFELTDDIELQAVRNITVTDAVDVSAAILMNKSLNLGITHTVVLGSSALVLRAWVWNQQNVDPGWTAVYEDQVGDFIILGPDELPTISMTLPRPAWDDVDELTRRSGSIRRNRTGAPKTFVVPVYEGHRYVFEGLLRFKAHEFRNIVKTLLGKRVRIRDHNGVWKHVLITNERLASVQKGPEYVNVEFACEEVDRVA